ncbi:hypothetical protein ACFE04_019739 [Oxalis oulophora]
MRCKKKEGPGSVHTFRRGARERKSCLKVFPFMRSVVGGILQSLSAVLGEHKSGLIRKELLRGMTSLKPRKCKLVTRAPPPPNPSIDSPNPSILRLGIELTEYPMYSRQKPFFPSWHPNTAVMHELGGLSPSSLAVRLLAGNSGLILTVIPIEKAAGQ